MTSLNTAIKNTKKRLINKVEKQGLYENFGQTEYRKLKDRYIDITDYSSKMNSNREKLRSFSSWAESYTGKAAAFNAAGKDIQK